MALAIRLSRGGAKKHPFYRIVVADRRMPRDGRFIERLGSYDPMVAKDHPQRVTLNKERIRYWLSVGAQPSRRITHFLYREKMADKPTITDQTKKDKPRPKTIEKAKAREEKIAEAKANAAEQLAKEQDKSSDADAPSGGGDADAAKGGDAPAASAPDGSDGKTSAPDAKKPTVEDSGKKAG